MTNKEALYYVGVIIEEAKASPDGEVVIDDVDLEALNICASALRSEIMEEQAGADQKAWEDKFRHCYDCKWKHKVLYDEPCVRCDALSNDLWEEVQDAKESK